MADFLRILAVFLTLWCSSYGLYCWHCNTKSDGEACGDPFNETVAENVGIHQINCTEWALNDVKHPFNEQREPISCYKIHSYNTQLVNTEKIVAGKLTRRACSFVDKDKSWHQQGVQGGAYEAYCQTDGCNYGVRLLASAATVLTFLISACIIT